MSPRIMLLLPSLWLAGCATGPSLQSQMASYIGSSPQILVQKLGVPDKQITVSGVQYLAYDRHHEELDSDYATVGFGGPFGGPFDGGFYGRGFYGAGIYGVGGPQRIEQYSCETTFMLKDDKVYDFTLRGNDCS